MKVVLTTATPKETTVLKAGGKSKIAYPYNDLDQSIEVAKAIQNQGGGVCGADHLAEFLGYSSARSGTFFRPPTGSKNVWPSTFGRGLADPD